MFSKPEPNGTPDPIDGLENSRFEHENGEVKQSEGGEKDGRNLHRWQKIEMSAFVYNIQTKRIDCPLVHK